MNNLQNVVEIKPVEPRKQAIPISKLRQPSKLRLRPNILVIFLKVFSKITLI